MIYYLYEEQDGGCDYSIGCGLRLTRLKATNMEDAIKEALPKLCTGDNEFGIQRASIIEATQSHKIDVAALKEERDSIVERDRAELNRLKELSELKRLKELYEK
jgi:hypothetical protein